MSQIDTQMQAQIEDAAQEQVKDLPVSSVAWLAEIKAALKREKQWRKDAKAVLDRYRNEQNKSDVGQTGGFNILWSNTET